MDLLDELIAPIREKLLSAEETKLAEMYDKCYRSTWDTTLKRHEDGTTFLITGDIPAMWLRDSSAQVRHYLPESGKHKELADVMEGLIKKQFFFIWTDPYANAFNEKPDGSCFSKDRTEQGPLVWERKYEIDSLCYPIVLAYDFWKTTGRTGWCNNTFFRGAQEIIKLWKTEQRHSELSPYYFERTNCPPSDTLPNQGRGTPVGYTGMTWSGFRPSDDACRYGYLIPSNFFAVRALERLEEIFRTLLHEDSFADTAKELAGEIRKGLEACASTEHREYGKIYAYETDGLGNYSFMDDANVPSLLSLPYLGCLDLQDPVYVNTRRFILSRDNPYFYQGTAAKGVGSPHTPAGYVWPISLCMQGLTSVSQDEIHMLMKTLVATDAGTCFMHESIDVNNPKKYTRPWFAWANSLFCEFAAKYCETL